MRRILFPILFILSAACAGQRAREAASPAVAGFYKPVAQLAHVGVDAALAAGELTPPQVAAAGRVIDDAGSALAAGNPRAVAWTLIEPMAQRGIAARVSRGELTEGTAGSLREQVRLFGLLLAEVQK